MIRKPSDELVKKLGLTPEQAKSFSNDMLEIIE
jgi:polyhydroxyalkanoate synthesis regulator phasin